MLGTDDVRKVVCGVSSSRELFERGGAAGAQLVLVHHGLFWRNEPLVVDRRLRGRLEALFASDLTLAAYHIALDAHPEVGNNVQLAQRIGVTPDRQFAGIGTGGRVAEPVTVDELVSRVRKAVDREPLVFASGPERIERVAVSTGASGFDLVQAARDGYDAFVTGEAEEPNLHAARELGIHLIAAGHYATERFGVQALAALLADRFGLDWEFLDLPNPV